MQNNSKKYLLKSTLIYSVLSFIQPAINFILLPFYLDHLTPEEYGIYNMMNYVSLFFNLISGASLGLSFINFYYKYSSNPKRLEQFIKSVFSVIFFINLLLLVLFCFIGPFIFEVAFQNESTTFFPYGILSCAIGLFGNLTASFFAVVRNKKDLNFYTLAQSVGFISTIAFQIVLVLYLNLGITALLTGKLVSIILILLLMIAKYKPLTFFIQPKLLGPAFKYSIHLIWFNMLVWLFNHLDRFILEKYFDPDRFGFYTFIFTIGSIIQIIIIAIGSAFQPIIFESIKANQEKTVQKLQVLFVNAVLVFYPLLSVLVLFIDSFLSNKDYVQFQKELILCLTAFTLSMFQYLFSLNAVYKQKSYHVGFINLSGGILFVLLLFVIPEIGILEAILALLASKILAIPVYYFISKKAIEQELMFNETLVYPIGIVLFVLAVMLLGLKFDYKLLSSITVIFAITVYYWKTVSRLDKKLLKTFNSFFK